MRPIPIRRVPSARLSLTVGCCMVLAFVASILLHRMPPSLGDFGDWVYEAALLRDYLLVNIHAGYLLKHYPVPNSFNTVVMSVLMLGMPWQWAARLYLCLQLAFQLFAAVVFFHAARSVRPNTRPEVWFIAPGAVFFGINFWYGFMNFQVGVAWAMLVCALLLWRAKPALPYAVLLVLAFFTHMIPCAFACLALVFAALSDSRPRRLLALLPTLALTAWYLVGRFHYAHNADATAPIDTRIRYGSRDFFAYKVNSFLKSFGFVNPSSNADHSILLRSFGEHWFLALFAANALLAAIFLWLLLRRCLRSQLDHSLDAFLWRTIVVFAVVYLVAPGMALGVSDPGSRCLQVALWIGMFLAADNIWPVRLAALCAICLFAVNLSMFRTLENAPLLEGEQQSYLPGVLTHFGHVPFQDKLQYYDAIEQGRFDMEIFPTGLFLKR